MEEQLKGVLHEISCGSHNNKNKKQKQNKTIEHKNKPKNLNNQKLKNKTI